MNPEEAKAAGLPESVHEWNEVKESKDAVAFWDQMKNVRSKIGTGLYQPGEDAGSEDWGKFSNKAVELSGGRLMPMPNSGDAEQMKALNKALGVPDDLKGYEFSEVEGSVLDEGRQDFIRQIAMDSGLTTKQLKSLDQKYREKDVELMGVQREAFDDGLKELQREWGLASDDRINQAKKVQKAFFGHIPDGTELSAQELKAFYALYGQLNDKSQEFAEQEHQSSGISPADAEEKIMEILNNPKHPYNNTLSPGHEGARKKVRALYLAKNGMK